MAKFYETSDSLKELIEDEFAKTGIDVYGVDIKIMSTKKSKDLITVSKANPTTSYLTHVDDMIVCVVYEEALDRLDEHGVQLMVEMALSNVWFDTEKDKLNVDKNPYKAIFNMRKKYGEEFLDILEAGYMAIDQIADEQKAKKEGAE